MDHGNTAVIQLFGHLKSITPNFSLHHEFQTLELQNSEYDQLHIKLRLTTYSMFSSVTDVRNSLRLEVGKSRVESDKIGELNESDESDSESDGDVSNFDCVSLLRKRKFVLAVQMCDILSLEGSSQLDNNAPAVRRGNIHRDRALILNWATTLDDTMFARQFRLAREDFEQIVSDLTVGMNLHHQNAINSSGSPVNARLCLMITLRIFAGASYLDMIHYHVHVDSVHNIVWRTTKMLNKQLKNIKVAANEDDMKEIARAWSEQQYRRWGAHLSSGTLYAGDGFAVEISQPSAKELRGRSLGSFRNRKGFWALIVQAFCDVNTRFSVFDCKWPGGVNDIIAYSMTTIYSLATSNHFPEWCTFVLDEAYSPCGGMHLTPFSVHQLRRAKSTNTILYYKMLAFNNVLSSQRITIERAFGILVRRWGILWRPILFALHRVATIVKVCAKLHNVCVDRWVQRGRPMNRKGMQQPDVPDHVNIATTMPTDAEIINKMHNSYIDANRASADHSLRTKIMDDIYNAGIRVHNDFDYVTM